MYRDGCIWREVILDTQFDYPLSGKNHPVSRNFLFFIVAKMCNNKYISYADT